MTLEEIKAFLLTIRPEKFETPKALLDFINEQVK